IEIGITFKAARWLKKLGVGLLLLYRRGRYGYPFRRIRFSGPRYAKVDPEDYERLAGYEWFCAKRRGNFYGARMGAIGESGKRGIVYMHREVIEVGKGMVADHVNHDGADNRKANLRAATRGENGCNKRMRRVAGTSKYKGVMFKKSRGKWVARIGVGGRQIHLGYFEDEIDAAKAYDNAARKYHGEFAALNFPDGSKAVRKK
ncbi:MAG: HNH endonuclease, partial [Methanosarcinaceae archaeon]|nr:HNH endonuclease [Methanosarcinaceae archaeon]